MKKTLMIAACVAFTAHCGQKKHSDTSKISVFGGEIIDGGKFPAVVQIKNDSSFCTATFISENTLITAAHCVLTQQRQKPDDKDEISGVDIKVVQSPDAVTKKIFAHPKSVYSASGKASFQNSANDVAIIVLDNLKSDHMAKIATKSPEVRDDVTMIGFGLPSRGLKQRGFNEVSKLAPGLIFSIFDVDSIELKAATIGPGDSGGPLFIGGKIAGIASAGNSISSFHTDLTSKSTREFLQTHLDASFFK